MRDLKYKNGDIIQHKMYSDKTWRVLSYDKASNLYHLEEMSTKVPGVFSAKLQ